MSDTPGTASPAQDAPSDTTEEVPSAEEQAPSEARSPDDQWKFNRTSGPEESGVPYQLPDLPPYFVSRQELEAVKKMLLGRLTASLAPLTLHGPTGSGKTSLAIALAHDADLLEAYPDGVLWYSLGGEGDVQHAQAQWADELRFDISHLPDTASRAAALRTVLRDSKAMLIIDDVTNPDQVKALNVGGPNCIRIITTDHIEDLYGFKTRRYAVTRMKEDESLEMLTEWAGILPDIYLPTVSEIVQRLMYAPLTLALVGAQARQGITWLRLLEVLRDEQGPLATIDPEDAEQRRQSLGLVLNLVLSRFGSTQLDRSRELAAFTAGTSSPFSIGAAAACWKMEMEKAENSLNTLAEASLVQRLPDGFFAMHTAISDHLRRSSPPGVVEEAASRVRDYYLGVVEATATSGQIIDRQFGQIMAAYRYLEVNDLDKAETFAAALLRTFEERGLWHNFAKLSKRVVEGARKADDLSREDQYLSDLGYAYSVMSDYDSAIDSFQRSLEIAREMHDPDAEATALNNLGAIYERQGDYESARAHYQMSLDLREHIGIPDDMAEALNNLAGVYFWQQNWDEALNTFQRVLDMYNVLDNRDKQAQTWLNIGAVYESDKRDVDAQHAYQRSLAIYTNLGNEAGQAQALNNLGIIYLHLGETDRALSHFKRSLALKEKLGDRQGEASTLNNIALLYEKTGSSSLALDHYERAYFIFDSLEDPRAEIVQENIDTLRGNMK